MFPLEQASLRLARKPAATPVPIEMVRTKRTKDRLSAWRAMLPTLKGASA